MGVLIKYQKIGNKTAMEGIVLVPGNSCAGMDFAVVVILIWYVKTKQFYIL